jgi:hypothetical protein
VDAVGFFDGEDGDDVWMIERGDGAGFALEAGEALGIGSGVGGRTLRATSRWSFVSVAR